MPLRVLIADDDEVIRALVRRMIEGVVQVVGEATDDAQAMQMAEDLQPDVVLLDIDLPHKGGVKVTHGIKARHPRIKIVLMTAHEEEAYLSDTGWSGADAILPKKRVKNEALSVIRILAGDPLRLWNGLERRGWPSRPPKWNGWERRRRRPGAGDSETSGRIE